MSKNLATDLFQGACLVQKDGAGAKYMPYYDYMPSEIRELARNSSYNLCPACILQRANEMKHSYRDAGITDSIYYRKAIMEMETEIRMMEQK